MKVKLINMGTAFVIFFACAALIEVTIGWGAKNPWPFILFWSGGMALAEVIIMEPFRRRLKQKNAVVQKPKNK